jgi:hypothetical protein
VCVSEVPSVDTAHTEHTDCNTNCCCNAGNCAVSQIITVCIGRVLRFVVLLADTACFVTSDPDRPTHLQNMIPQHKQSVAPH